jgi:hypothetical protein
MSAIRPYTDEQARALINLRQRYEVWIEAERALAALPYDLRRKTINGAAYLYEIKDRGGNGKSLGAWTETLAAKFEAYRAEKTGLKERIGNARGLLDESGRLVRAVRLPMLASEAGTILREADRRSLLGDCLYVVGTNCMIAYAQEAAGLIVGAPDETEDFDIAWVAQQQAENARVWDLLKAVDPTFTMNTEREFQARNAKAYEVELLIAPSRAATLARRDKPRPIPLPEQEWLLLGRPVDQIVACRDGTAARVVAPDPRWFALQKLWMSAQPKRNPLKRTKDRKQGTALLNAIDEAMPHYPLDAGFVASLPDELLPYWSSWADSRSEKRG